MTDRWRGGQLLFLRTTDGTRLEVGWVCGPLAVHPTCSVGRWTLSHVATGMRIANMDEQSHAFTLAALLLHEVRGCLEQTDPDIVQMTMPRKMAEYIFHCNAHRKLLPLSVVGWEEQE